MKKRDKRYSAEQIVKKLRDAQWRKEHRGSTSGKRLSPAQKRETVKRLQRKFSVSECRACRCIGLSRTSVRYRRREKSDEA